MEERLKTLSKKESSRLISLLNDLSNNSEENKDTKFLEVAEIAAKADAFDPLDVKSDLIKAQYNIFESVWGEAEKLRENGSLFKMGDKIKCSVVAIHGDHDPHLYKSVKRSLKKAVKNLNFILLEKCGHRPWIEKYAKDKFYKILKKESNIF